MTYFCQVVCKTLIQSINAVLMWRTVVKDAAFLFSEVIYWLRMRPEVDVPCIEFPSVI